MFACDASSLVAYMFVTQSCLENNLILITRDNDFRHYEKYFHLKVLKPH